MTIWKRKLMKNQLNSAEFLSSFPLERFGKIKANKGCVWPWLHKNKAEHASHICFETFHMLSPGLLAQQAGKAPCGPLRWLLQYSCADGNHYSSLKDASRVHRALQAPCRNLEAARLNRSRLTPTLLFRQKELLKPSDKNHFLSPLEKKQNKITEGCLCC